MKATWHGTLSIGRLGVPVRLYTATRSLEPRFVQLHEQDGSPIERPLQCRAEHRAISPEEVVRAIEYEPGRYLTFTSRELARTAPFPPKTITVQQFCRREAVEPQFYEKPFYVVPARGGERAYALLREVFVRNGAAAIAGYMYRGGEHIGALGVQGDLLMLFQLRFAGELVPRSDLPTPPLAKPSPAEVSALTAVVERFSGPLYMQDYHNQYAERIAAVASRKARGLPPPRGRERTLPTATPEEDILPVLRDTLQEPRMIAAAGSSGPDL